MAVKILIVAALDVAAKGAHWELVTVAHIKKLTSVPLVAKRASGVALALLGIFTEQGPPAILQTDNGGEFSGSATNHDGHRLLLDDEVITE